MSERLTFNTITQQLDSGRKPTVLVERPKTGEIVTATATGAFDPKTGREYYSFVEDGDHKAKPLNSESLSDERQYALADELASDRVSIDDMTDVTHDATEIKGLMEQRERTTPHVAEELGGAALDAAGVRPATEGVQVPAQEERTKEREQVFSSAELGEYNSLLQEMIRQSAALRQYGEQGRIKHDGDIAEQARGHLGRLESGHESADAGLVAIGSILAGITGQAERSAVFDMMRRSKVLADEDLRRIGNELGNLEQLDQVPGLESDQRKFQYSEYLRQQANANLEANDGAATKLYLAFKAMAGGVGSRMNDATYRQRIVDGAVQEIAASQR